ncbi:MAG: Fic family protein [Candidatus Ancaeobacter aquaticus]|nr:Fic family protein [Candidatus Ancaeobacter aquaticus]
MNSFKNNIFDLPLGTVWLMNSVSEYKGKQDLYSQQSPQALKTLVEMALIESVESSNRIEGVTVDSVRLKPLVIGHSRPRDRSEEEVSGYRKALDLIHAKHGSLRITSETIKELHRLCRGESHDAGVWNEKDNDIIRKFSDGRVEVVYKPLSAKETPKYIEQLCLSYEHSVTQLKYPPLYAVACLILDFLCIHPFRDGNGRVSRLLTLLALYQHEYAAGKYISLERVVEQSKETYYESLNRSSWGWQQGKHDTLPWTNYFLGTVLGAYKELERRAVAVSPRRGAKTGIIEAAVNDQLAEFSISDIERVCPGISRVMIKKILLNLKIKKKIKCLGKGQSAKWLRIVSLL